VCLVTRVRHDRARACQSVDDALVLVLINPAHFYEAPYEAVVRVSGQRVMMGFKALDGGGRSSLI
jgi:hypothetical protein